MSILAAIPVIGQVLEGVLGIVDKAVLDKDKANEIKSQVQLALMQMDYSSFDKEIEARARIITAEAQGSWIQRSWRPILMLTIIAIVANNYLIFPYMDLLGYKATMLALPDRLWGLMEIGVGGYIVGRSGEKIVTKWKNTTQE